MADILYWSSRAGLVLAWLAAAALCWSKRQGRAGFWPGAALLAVLFASLRAWPWNYAVLDAARSALRRAGVYDDRIWIKAVLAIALACLVVLLLRRWRHLAAERATLVCHLALGVQATLLAVETASLDDPLPGWLFQQPGRYLFEGACAALALGALVLAERREVRAS